MTQLYFGTPWDVPAVEDANPAPTPVGEACWYCTVAVVEGDQGFIMPGLDVAEDGTTVVCAPMPIHRECMLASVLGCGVPCAEGTCTCRSGGPRPGDPGQPSVREAALATWQWAHRHGRPPD